jgi:hypothetical protein
LLDWPLPSKSPEPKKLRLELLAEEVKALLTLAEDQLFRMKFIDPKLPGHRANPELVWSAESAIAALKDLLKEGSTIRTPTPSDIQISPRRPR